MRAILLTLLVAWSTPALAAGTNNRDTARRVPTENSRTGKQRTGKKGKKQRKGMKIDDVSPLHGVLIYGPKLETHEKYERLTKGKKSAIVAKKDLPERDVSRDGSIAVGLTAGTLQQGYTDGSSSGNLGLGIKGRYRPMEYLGLELGVQRHSDGFLSKDSVRTMTTAGVDVFVFPWSKLSPYATAGLALSGRPDATPNDTRGNLTGLQAGIGLEFSPTKSLGLDLEAKTTRWMNMDPADTFNPSSLQLGGAVMFHF